MRDGRYTVTGGIGTLVAASIAINGSAYVNSTYGGNGGSRGGTRIGGTGWASGGSTSNGGGGGGGLYGGGAGSTAGTDCTFASGAGGGGGSSFINQSLGVVFGLLSYAGGGPSGTGLAGPGRNGYATLYICPAGSFCSSGTPVLCPPGTYCPLASVNPIPCPVGTYSDEFGSSSCTPCAIGSFCLYKDAPGYPCPAGFFGNSTELTVSTCSGSCSATAGYGCMEGSTSPLNATLCPVGYFCTGGNPAAAVPCTVPSLCSTMGMTADPTCTMGWNVSTYAGNGSATFKEGLGTNSSFYTPAGVTSDSSGNIYVGDMWNHKIRAISPRGLTSTLAGSTNGFSNGVGNLAKFHYPSGVVFDPYSGLLYVSDRFNHRIRCVSLSGVVTTIAGSSSGAWIGDGVGSNTNFNQPYGIAVDKVGVLYVADTVLNRIRRVTPLGVTTTLAGNGSQTPFYDGVGSEATFGFPFGIAVDSRGIILVSDQSNNRIRAVTPTGVVSTFAGSVLSWADGVGTWLLLTAPDT